MIADILLEKVTSKLLKETICRRCFFLPVIDWNVMNSPSKISEKCSFELKYARRFDQIWILE